MDGQQNNTNMGSLQTNSGWDLFKRGMEYYPSQKVTLGLSIVIMVLLVIPLFNPAAEWAKDMDRILKLALLGMLLGQLPSVVWGKEGSLWGVGAPIGMGVVGAVVGVLTAVVTN